MLTVTWAAFMMHQPTARRVVTLESAPVRLFHNMHCASVVRRWMRLLLHRYWRPDRMSRTRTFYALSKKNTRETWSASYTGEPVSDGIRKF